MKSDDELWVEFEATVMMMREEAITRNLMERTGEMMADLRRRTDEGE